MKRIFPRLSKIIATFVIAVGLLGLSTTSAVAQDTALLVPVNGFLTDAENRALDRTVEVKFSLYSDASGDSPFWTETQDLNVDNGSFSAYLGSYENLPVSHFEQHRAPYVSMQIEGDTEMDRWPIGHAPFAAFAEEASNAQTLQGMTPEDFATDDVTAGDVGYDDTDSGLGANDTQAAINAMAAQIAQLQQQLDEAANERSEIAGDVTGLSSRIGGAESHLENVDGTLNSLQSSVSNHDGRLTDVESDIATIESNVANQDGRLSMVEDELDDLGDIVDQDSRLTALEDKTEPMNRQAINGLDSIVFEGVNVHVRNGTGTTDGDVDGAGNLIVGYDENTISTEKTGSHNLVLGRQNSYTSFGGFVGGMNNSISNDYASVISGQSNTADGTRSVIVSGSSSETTGNQSAILAGYSNAASGSWSAVVAGSSNSAEGMDSVVVGGSSNTATGSQDVVVGN